MREEERDRLIDEIRAARPTLRPSAEEWVDSDRGRSVLERVLAEAVAAEAPADKVARGRRRAAAQGRRRAAAAGPAQGMRSKGGYRLRLAAGAALAAIILAVALGLVFAQPAGSPDMAGGSGTTAPGATTVARSAAVADVMRLLYTVGEMTEPGSETMGDAVLLEDAVRRGVVTSSSVEGESASMAMPEGEYAVLLWRAFGPLLATEVCANAGQPAGENGGAVGSGTEVASAVENLQSFGVIMASDGPFQPELPLSAERERLLMGRIKTLFETDR